MDGKKLSLATLLIFMAIAIIALYHNISPYKSPSALLNIDRANNIQVVGRITEVRADGGRTIFTLTDGKATIDVVYNGNVEQYDSEVVVVGDWDGSVLHAKEILKKCHTEYTGR